MPQTRRRSRVAAACPRLISLGTALPRHRVDQTNMREFIGALFADALAGEGRRLLRVFDNSGIESRRLCMPLEWYGEPHTLRETSSLYVRHALRLATEAAEEALGAAGLGAGDVDHVVLVSSTGIATPSLDARLAGAMGFRLDVRRTPIWGLGCAGGAAGLSRARDFALADPGARVLLIAVELCSLTFQHGDRDRRNIVATALFADGAAAAVVTGAEVAGGGAARPCGIELAASGSTLWPDTLDVMGWTVDEHGLHVVFSRDIPTIVRKWVRPDLEAFLAAHGLALGELSHLITHPGGPKVLAAYAEALGFPDKAFRHARRVLRSCGNMSSPSCLFVLDRLLRDGGIAAGETGVVAALGPGFSSEYVLVRGGA